MKHLPNVLRIALRSLLLRDILPVVMVSIITRHTRLPVPRLWLWRGRSCRWNDRVEVATVEVPVTGEMIVAPHCGLHR